MPTGSKYATGDRAWGLCQICGLRFLLRDLVFDGYYPNLRVCVPCYDPRQPQEFLVDVTDPTALYRPSPEWGPENQALSGEVFANDVQLNWTECILRGQPRVNTYLLYRSVSSDGVNFTATVLIATLPVLYYANLADLNENGNPPYNNQGIEAETLNFLDTVPSGADYARYQVFAKLDGGRMVNSNIVTLPIEAVGDFGSIASSADFLSGTIAAFLPPDGNSTESIQSAADFLSGSFATVDPFFGDVVLLVSFDGANNATTAPDLSPIGNTLTFTGTAKLTTTNPKFGSASLLTPGSQASVVSVPSSAGSPLDLSTGDFTVELWVNLTAVLGSLQPLISAGDENSIGFAVTIAANTGLPTFTFGAHFIPYPTAVTAGVWTAIAAVRQGNVFDFFVGGVASGNPFTWSTPLGELGPLYIGGAPNYAAAGILGKIDEVRITKGVCRYPPGVNYTPATSAFPTS